MVSDLTKYDGVFAVLGVKGRYTALSPMNAARLRLFLDQGGKVYLEGGDFFYNAAGSQAPTVLHPYFKAQATSDGGVMRMAGPIEGKNFLHGATFGLLDLATVLLDRQAGSHAGRWRSRDLQERESRRSLRGRGFVRTGSRPGRQVPDNRLVAPVRGAGGVRNDKGPVDGAVPELP